MVSTTHTTACPLDCPDTCSLSVTVDDGVITTVDAAPGNPFTDGFICQKVKHHARRVHGDDRVRTPLVRTGPKGSGTFRSATWDEALDLVVARIRAAIDEHGAESVVPYLYNASAGSLQSVLTQRLFRRLGASEVDITICALTHGMAYFATYPGLPSADPFDLVHSKLIVLWGANPTVTNTHLLPLITRAQREGGARVVVVDPRRTGIAKRADAWLAVRPGTDVALALAVARELEANGALDRDFIDAHVDGADAFLDAARAWTVERAEAVCGVDAAQIRELAHDLATIRPAIVRPGWGLERNRNGGSACAAVMALPALVGQFGVPGAGVLVSLSDAAPIERARRTEEEKHHPRPRHLNMNGLGAYLTDAKLAPPISVLFVQGANPVVMNPNQRAVLEGLARDDLFTIVHDQVLTDTARWADVVLPATTNFEYDDIAASYGSFTLQPVEKVIDPVGESVSNNALAAMLAERLGFGGPRFPAEASSLVGESVRDGVDASRPVVLHEPGTLVQFRDAFPIGGKAHLAGLFDLGVPRYVELDDAFPLALITPANPKTINSIFGEFNRPDPTVRVSPADAVARQLSDGQLVRVHNRAASVVATLRIDADIRAGVVAMTKGVWLRDTHEGVGVNALVPDTFSDVGDGACFNDARVEVSPA